MMNIEDEGPAVLLSTGGGSQVGEEVSRGSESDSSPGGHQGDQAQAPGEPSEGPVGARRLLVLIPSCTDQFLNVCLSSLERSEGGSLGNVIVGDNGLSDALKAKYPQVMFIDIPKPFVFARAINMLARAAGMPDPRFVNAEDGQDHHDFPDLLILNDDTEMETVHWHHWIRTAIADDRLAHLGMMALEINGGVGNEEQTVRHGDPYGVTPNEKPLMFVAVVIRAETWLSVGTLDERFVGYGFDDNDYFARCKEKGIQTAVIGAARVKHGMGGMNMSSTYGRVTNQAEWNRKYEMNGRLFRHKYGIGAVTNRLCLNIGCGDKPKPDEGLDRWLNLDIQNFDGVQIVRDLRRGIPVPDETFDHVLCDNVLEHFATDDVIFIINEIDRILKVGGTAEIVVPHALIGQGAYQDPTHKTYFVPRSVIYWNQSMSSRGGRFVGITANLLPDPDPQRGVQEYGDPSNTEVFIRFRLKKHTWENPTPSLVL